MRAWIGVDLDGTLAENIPYGHWDGIEIGAPVPVMVERVKTWLDKGVDVRIFTARVGADLTKTPEDLAAICAEIERWCAQHVGRKLPITCSKDFAMVQLWDDRAVTVERDTGRILTSSPNDDLPRS